jgi:hypothetical protein
MGVKKLRKATSYELKKYHNLLECALDYCLMLLQDVHLDVQLDLLDHTQLHTITVYTLYNSLQFTITLAESSHYIFTRCLSSNIAGSVRLQLCNSSLKTAARPEYSLVTRNWLTP